ncbi:hydantoinase/oxoprolinase family protein [Sulfitobacter sediminilitoris]|uniref:hydantoinase/oxoprolinase family protein n=1 Tax=Sulfitobacter sediminilitoris TaxID=2698830 RepID=UPI003615596C
MDCRVPADGTDDRHTHHRRWRWVNCASGQGGAFKVGPRSAGARPGPAAYGHGGTEPTVTDANVVLGRLDPNNFLGGEMGLDVEASQAALDRLATQLGMDRLAAAEGVITIINANMANAIRSRTVQKGLDPRDFALVAFGGGGPSRPQTLRRCFRYPR